MKLMREVCCFPYSESGLGTLNSWAGSPGNIGLGSFWVLRAIVEGRVDAKTGYVCSITDLDTLLRQSLLPVLVERLGNGQYTLAQSIRAWQTCFQAGKKICPANTNIDSLEWCLSPYLTLSVGSEDENLVQITTSFEFSASHRLHCAVFSEDENRRVFGKCSNPNGHGHNYVLEVTVLVPEESTEQTAHLPRIQQVVRKEVIDRFDHKHLNLDCLEFTSLNPSVENIARVIWTLLHEPLKPRTLSRIRVWETPKTYAEYDGRM